ncbi:hypothetical protein C2S08_01330 [Helicobacter pylori]|nr:hypothetical protein C2S08_01330 [Helicobacter pylori]
MRKVFVFNEGLIIKSKKCAKAFLKSIIKSLQKAGGNFLKIKNDVCQYPMKKNLKVLQNLSVAFGVSWG